MESLRRSTPACVNPCVQHEVDDAAVSVDRLLQVTLRVNFEAVHVRASPVGQPVCPPNCSSVAVPHLWVHTELVADRFVGCVVEGIVKRVLGLVCRQCGASLVKDSFGLVVDVKSKYRLR